MTPVEWALIQLGVREATGRNDGDPSKLYADGEQIAWCAAFVRTAFEKTGNPLPGNRWTIRAVATMRDELAKAGALLSPGTKPARGDIIGFRTRVGSDAGGGNHVGLVVEVLGDRVRTIEGNVGNAVAIRTHKLTSPEIWFYGRWPRKAA